MTTITLAVSAWGAYWLAKGAYLEMLVGALLTQLGSILDGNDGELARLTIRDSDYGTWLDTICDYISYFLTFGGISLGLYNRTGEVLYLQLGATMFLGAFIAMVLTSRLRKKYTGEGGAGSLKAVVFEDLSANKQDWGAFLAKHLHHFGTRATFSYFVLLFGLVNGWPILVYLAAFGAHLYWIAIVYNERFLKRRSMDAV